MNIFRKHPLAISRRLILGLPVCDFDWDDAFTFADNIASMPFGQTVIAFMNANNANLMMKDPEYRAVLQRQIIFPDGHGVDIASLMFHKEMFPANLNGTDFVPAMLTFMAEPKRVALIGARPDVLRRAVENLRKQTPWHTFFAVSDGYFDRSKSDEILAKVRELRVDILLVAMGSPEQEKWIDRYVGPGHARLVISVGALFDFVAGEVPRAPPFVRSLRMEWLFRLFQEPGRLWRRYIFGNPVFIYHLIRHKLRGGAKNSTHSGLPGPGSF